MKPHTESIRSIAVLGAGSWGTALAIHLARNGIDTHLWGLEEEIAQLGQDGENRRFLPGIQFPPNLQLEVSLKKVATECDEILVVVPSHAFAPVLRKLDEVMPSAPSSLSWATKGFDPESRSPLSDVAREIFPETDFAVISGPTFAVEVAQGLPTAITCGSTNEAHGKKLADALGGETFRAYTSNDIIGVQVGGATKNAIAIAAGISDGLGFGANSRAALITRGLAELSRLGVALGGHAETFMGLAGLGDLVLTCTDNKSRNRRMGLAVASGKSVDEVRQEIGQEVEGVSAARDIHLKAKELGIEMPITEEVYRILYKELDPSQAVKDLLHRKQKAE